MNIVGVALCAPVGDADGLTVGDAVGDTVGLAVGDAVGDAVGVVVGYTVVHTARWVRHGFR